MGNDQLGVDTPDDRARRLVDDGDHPAALALALAAEDWSLVADIIEADWPRLFMKHPVILREVYTATPATTFRHHPAARAVREMLFPVAPPIPGAPPAELPSDPETLHEIATGPEAVDALRAGLATMIALRLREEWDTASRQARRLTSILEVAHRRQFDAVAHRIPGTEIQIGITFMMAGDAIGALRHLQRAHRTADLDTIGHVARDSAAKIALINAIRGDVHAAIRWLERSDAAPDGETALDDHVESSRLSARALIAVARLDRTEARRAQAEMGHGLIEEELWAFRLHALARVGLFLGDLIGVRRLLDEAHAVLPYARQPSPPIRDLLLADSLDLSMALNAGGEVSELLATSTWKLPVVDMCQARLLLLTGDPKAALAHAQTALASRTVSSRVEVEALVLSAIANEQLERRHDAAERLRSAATRAAGSGSITGFAMVPTDQLTALADAVGQDLPDDVPELFPSSLSIVELTPRERAVLHHLAAGRYLSEIASIDFVSINTVKSQVRSIYRKVGASDRDEAVRLGQRFGLL